MIIPESAANQWRLNSGFRLLRATCPENAEYLFEFHLQLLRLVEARATAGHRGAFNVVRRDVAGRKRNITLFPDGAGRTWSGDFPAEYADLPKITPELPDPTSLNMIAALLASALHALPAEIAGDYQQRLQSLEANREPGLRLSDLSPLHTKATTATAARNRARLADTIMRLIDVVHPARGEEGVAIGLQEFARHCEQQWNADLLDGSVYAPLLLFATLVALSPATFAPRVCHFVCGQLPCDHLTCNANVKAVVAADAARGGPAANGAHAAQAYVLRNEVDLQKFLDAATVRAATAEIDQVSRHLLSIGDLRAKELPRSKTAREFYAHHHEALPFAAAATWGFAYLARRATSEETRQAHERLRVHADEIVARSLNALRFDLTNSVDLLPLHCLRNDYRWRAEQSPMDAELHLQKLIDDEMLIPGFWADFVRGKTENFSCAS